MYRAAVVGRQLCKKSRKRQTELCVNVIIFFSIIVVVAALLCPKPTLLVMAGCTTSRPPVCDTFKLQKSAQHAGGWAHFATQMNVLEDSSPPPFAIRSYASVGNFFKTY